MLSNLMLSPAMWDEFSARLSQLTQSAGSFSGGLAGPRRRARRQLYTLIATAKLNGVDPQAWLADVLGSSHDHPASQLWLFLPWY